MSISIISFPIKIDHFRAQIGKLSSNTLASQTGYKRFDAGLYVTAGYQLPQGLRLSIARKIGLINLHDEQGCNRVWSLNMAYPLKKLIALVKKKSLIN